MDRLKLEDSWKQLLLQEFQQPYMTSLREFLLSEKQKGKVIYPAGGDIFNALNSTAFDKVKVVILGQDPYHGPGQAHGLCFSVKPGVVLPPSLKNIYKEIASDLGIPPAHTGCLQSWAQQGVLLLNAVLTVESGNAASHQGKGWETFTDRIVALLNDKRENLVFLLWGSYAQRKGAIIDRSRHLVLESVHPSPLSASRGFFGNHHFSRANHYLLEHGQAPIDWRVDSGSVVDVSRAGPAPTKGGSDSVGASLARDSGPAAGVVPDSSRAGPAPTRGAQVCVVVGASHAGSQLAVQLRKEGWSGRIVLIGAESHIPYHRPPLSKAVLAGDKSIESIALRPVAMYETNAIELRLGQRVDRVLPQEQRVVLADGEEIAYDKLALCTGARTRRIALGEGLAGVHYLRTADDVLAIRQDLAPGKKAVIVGGGYIGLEVAAVFAALQLDVTVLEMAERILQRVTSEPVSEYFKALHESHGVKIVTNTTVSGIRGEGSVEGVICDDGTEYPADIVIIGVGVVPETNLADAAGLEVANGIVVDEHARTSDPHIYAAGDCTWHPSALYGRHLRLECVQNALDQSRVAAANIAGNATTYDALPWFWSDQYEIKLQSAGLVMEYDQLLIRGDRHNADGKGFSVFYLRGDRMVAADCVNRAKEFIACKRLIGERLAVNMAALVDENSTPDTFAAS